MNIFRNREKGYTCEIEKKVIPVRKHTHTHTHSWKGRQRENSMYNPPTNTVRGGYKNKGADQLRG